MRFLLSVVTSLLFSISILHAQTINTAASYIEFEVGHMGKTAVGTIKDMRGTVQFDPENPEAASFDVTVAPTTVSSGSKGRDKHVQRKDYFFTETYPTVRMVSKSVTKTEDGYQATATLTIKEQAQEVVIPFTATEKEGAQVLEGSFSLQRKEYDLATSVGKALIGLDVQIKIHAVVQPE